MKRESFNAKYQPVLVPNWNGRPHYFDLLKKDESLDSNIARLKAYVIEEETPTIKLKVDREGYNNKIKFLCEYKGITFTKDESISNSIPFLKSENINKGTWEGKVFFDKQGATPLIRIYEE